MVISELIAELIELKIKHGDLPIYTYERNHGGPTGWVDLNKCPVKYSKVSEYNAFIGHPMDCFYI